MATLLDGKLHVHYGQAYVFSGDTYEMGDMHVCFRGQTNGLLGAAHPGMLLLITGLHTGQVRFKLDVLDEEPALDASWEECVEVTFTPAADGAQLVDWDGTLVCELPLATEPYRVRYQARGMDAAREADTVLEDEEPIDAYAVSFWPAPPSPDAVVRQKSEIAAYWHGWAQELTA
ncbi:MAG: hypothetical protein ACJ74D_08425 [Gaiellaceae bacterium]